jgi:hypothetical protein
MVVATLLLIELAMRMAGHTLSTDLRHIREIPRLAKELAAADGTRMLFLGNSLTRQGFDPEAFARALRENSTEPPAVRRVYPDDTTIVEWSALVHHYFFDADRAPDIVVVGFARDHLSDATTVHPARLGRYYSSLSDIPTIFRYDLVDFEARSEYLIAYASAAFGNRRRIPRRFFDLWVPHFRVARSEINRSLRKEPTGPASHPTYSYTRLERFGRLLREENVRGIAVAMPLPEVYPLDPGLREALDAQGIELVDARVVPGISRASYRDSQHLAPDGARTYSEWLARRLAPDLAK